VAHKVLVVVVVAVELSLVALVEVVVVELALTALVEVVVSVVIGVVRIAVSLATVIELPVVKVVMHVVPRSTTIIVVRRTSVIGSGTSIAVTCTPKTEILLVTDRDSRMVQRGSVNIPHTDVVQHKLCPFLDLSGITGPTQQPTRRSLRQM